jgi:hypothetical protein
MQIPGTSSCRQAGAATRLASVDSGLLSLFNTAWIVGHLWTHMRGYLFFCIEGGVGSDQSYMA